MKLSSLYVAVVGRCSMQQLLCSSMAERVGTRAVISGEDVSRAERQVMGGFWY